MKENMVWKRQVPIWTSIKLVKVFVNANVSDIAYSISSFVINFWVDILESLKFKLIFRCSCPIEGLFSLNEFVRQHFGVSVSDLDSSLRTTSSRFNCFYLMISTLKIGSSHFTVVVSNDSVDWSLWSISSAVRKGLLRKWNISTRLFQSTHTKWNSRVICLSKLVVIFGCNHSRNCCLLVKFFEVTWIVWIIIGSSVVILPRSADLSGTFLVGLVWLTIREFGTW